MCQREKCIYLFLMDGDPSGRIKCSLANWTGVAYKIPRTDLEKCKACEHLNQSGVYFLFGKSDDTEKDVVYIGQAGVRKNGEGILNRLQEHQRNPDKDYWTEAVVFTTRDDWFGPTEISYLENRFCEMAKVAKRFIVKNGNEPSPGNVTDEKKCELEEFICYAKIVMGTLGYRVFEPYTDPAITEPTTIEGRGGDMDGGESIGQSDDPDDGPNLNQVFYIRHEFRNREGKYKAQGKLTREGFVVLIDSQIDFDETETIPKKAKRLRDDAKLEKSVDENGFLQEDYLFPNPSIAAAFVTASSVNGLTEWKTADGIALRDFLLKRNL